MSPVDKYLLHSCARTPKKFFARVHRILTRSSHGVSVHHAQLKRDPIVSETTPGEINFALHVESFLDALTDPAERQIVVECLLVISEIESRNQEVRIGGKNFIPLMAIVDDAYELFWDEWLQKEGASAFGYSLAVDGTSGGAAAANVPTLIANGGSITKSPAKPMYTHAQALQRYPFSKNREQARSLFFDLQQEGESGTMTFLARAIFRIASLDIKAMGGGALGEGCRQM